jgi:hypothetical protein
VLQCSAVPGVTVLSLFSEFSHFSCYSAQSFLVAIVCLVISLLLQLIHFCYSELNHFCYSAQPFSRSCQSFFYGAQSFCEIAQSFSRSCQSFCYSAKPFCKIVQSFSRFRRSFYGMTHVGASTWGGSVARSGTHGSVKIACSSVGWVNATKPHRTKVRETEPHGGTRVHV